MPSFITYKKRSLLVFWINLLETIGFVFSFFSYKN